MIDKIDKHPIVISVAGSDSAAGAGIQADIKSAAACGAYMATAITAITAQNGVGVSGILAVDSQFVKEQIDAVASDMNVVVLKSGMLPSKEIVDIVIDSIGKYCIRNVVVDPVIVSTSGSTLIPEPVVEHIISSLLPLATVVTPNIIEASYISGVEINGLADFDLVAPYFKKIGCKYLLLKGGHLDDAVIVDRLYDLAEDRHYDYSFEKIDSRNTHGTGCSLSSAIAGYLSRGYSVVDSVENAENYIHSAILEGKDYLYSSGYGPIDHFYKLCEK